MVPFRGDYYVLKPQRRHLVRGNIYPVPDPKFPFLGVHFTPRMNGDVWLGPNAVLAFSREGYRFRDVRPLDLVDAFTFGGFLKFGRKNWRIGFDEMARDLSKRRFLASLQTYIPELAIDDLMPGPSGVRAQAIGVDGAMVDDFASTEATAFSMSATPLHRRRPLRCKSANSSSTRSTRCRRQAAPGAEPPNRKSLTAANLHKG